MLRLVGLFDPPSGSFDGARSETRVQSESGSRAVAQAIGTVESWLAADGVDSAAQSVGDPLVNLEAEK
jgi:hypothetical protein